MARFAQLNTVRVSTGVLPAGWVGLADVVITSPYLLGPLRHCRNRDRDARRLAARALKPLGSMFVHLPDAVACEYVCAAKADGWQLRQWIVWAHLTHEHTPTFKHSHSHVLWMHLGDGRPTFHDKRIRVPSARQLIYKGKRASKAGRIPDDTWLTPPDARRYKGGYELPDVAFVRMIAATCEPGGVVLDVAAHTGVVFATARRLERRFVGLAGDAKEAARIRHHIRRTAEP